MKRIRELLTDVRAGLADQRARRRARRPPGGRPAADGSIGFRGPLVAALVLCVLGLAISGSEVLLLATIALAVLVWAIESSAGAGASRHEIIVSQGQNGVPPAAHVEGATYAGQPPPIPADRPAPAPARKPAEQPRQSTARGARSLDYEGTLAELMTLVGEAVIVDVAPLERGAAGAASRLTGNLAAGSVDDGASAGRLSGRGLYFGVGEGSGFFLPALDFMGARRAGDELSIRLRGYTVTLRSPAAVGEPTASVSAS